MRQNIRVISNLLLLITAMIWGIAFVAQSVGMEHVGPWTFVFFRSIISAIALIPVSLLVQRRLNKAGKSGRAGELRAEDSDSLANSSGIGSSGAGRAAVGWGLRLKGGLACGLFLGTASICQQAGLVYTTAGKAGFITALYVVIVPVLGLLFHRKPEKKVWICVLLGLCGLYLISVKGGFTIEAGDAWVMLSAVLFAGQIMSIDYFSGRVENVVLMSNIQFLFAALIAFAGMLIFETPVMKDVLAAAVPILYAGLLSGAAGYTLQMIAQRGTDPTVASLLMSLESVFSVLAGWAILGQMLSVRELVGCALVMAAVILAQIPIHLHKKQK